MLRTDTTIEVATVKAGTGRINYVSVPAKRYGYLAIHLNLHIDPDKLLSKDFKLPGVYAVTHVPTGAKLSFNGTLKQLKSFCAKYGNDLDLWDNPNEKSKQIVEKAESFGLIRFIPLMKFGENK